MDYFDVYACRTKIHGKNHKELDLNSRKKEFERLLATHPSAETISIDGVDYEATITSNKQDENKMTKIIKTRLNTPVKNGTIISWFDRKWIVYLQEMQPNMAYTTSYAARANYLLKWVDKWGLEKQSWALVTGSMINSVKQNFRTWHGLITPQPNEFLVVLLPYHDIPVGQRFLINDRAWYCAGYDITSVPGINYIHLTEEKVDRDEDDREGDLANANNLNIWKIDFSSELIQLAGQAPYTLYPSVRRRDELMMTPLKFEVEDENIVEIESNGKFSAKIIPKQMGLTNIKVWLEENPLINNVLAVQVFDDITHNHEYSIFGDDAIKITQTKSYSIFRSTVPESFIPILSFTISDKNLVTGKLIDGMLELTANSLNKIGEIELIVNGDDFTLDKKIKIIPLW